MVQTLFPTKIALVATMKGQFWLRVPAETSDEGKARIAKRGDCTFVRWARADEARPNVLNRLYPYVG